VTTAANGAKTNISKMYYRTGSATTFSIIFMSFNHRIRILHNISQYSSSRLNRRSNICTAGADASPPPQLLVHLLATRASCLHQQ